MKQLLRRLIDLAGGSAAASAAFLAILVGATIVTQPAALRAQTLEDPTLAVSTVVSGLDQSIAMAFLGIPSYALIATCEMGFAILCACIMAVIFACHTARAAPLPANVSAW